MNKKIIALSLFFVSSAMADSYEVRYYIDKKSINFKEQPATETPELPVYGDWINSGIPYDCSIWTPSPNTVTTDKTLTQSQSCSQLQTRTVNLGQQTEETRVVTVQQNQTVNGKLSCSNYALGVYGMASYGSISNATLENPNYGTRISWNSQLIYSDLDQNFKADRSEFTIGQFVYVRKDFISSRNINFNSYNYKSYDYAVCRYPI